MNEQNERFLKHNQFARRLSVSPAYVTKLRKEGKAFRDDSTNTYDLQHPVNHALVVAAASTKAPGPTPEAIDDDELLQLQREKLRFERDRVREQAERYALQNAVTRGDLMPVEMVRAMYAEMSGAIRTYVLEVPNRVARGDVVLRDRIESELSDGLERWLEVSIAAFKRWVKEYYAEEYNEDEDDDLD